MWACACMHMSGQEGQGVVWWRGPVRWKDSKDKRVCVMRHNGSRSSASGRRKRDSRETETDKPTGGERERQRERRRDDQKDWRHNDEASDWTDVVSSQFALISVSVPLTDTT